jgi:hypothetical protein
VSANREQRWRQLLADAAQGDSDPRSRRERVCIDLLGMVGVVVIIWGLWVAARLLVQWVGR